MTATDQTQPNPASALAQPMKLPCGVEIPNRVVKGAMTEQLADENKSPTGELFRLYERWGQGGTGVLLTGNVMVDRRALEGPRNVVVEDDRDLDKLKEWADRAQRNGSQLWMQISYRDHFIDETCRESGLCINTLRDALHTAQECENTDGGL